MGIFGDLGSKMAPRRGEEGVWRRSWGQPKATWGYPGASWRRLGGVLAPFGSVLGGLGTILKVSREHFGWFFGRLGPICSPELDF